jgi:spermidine synthase
MKFYVWYAWTMFLSSFLLFQVQPLMGKYILPWFGGSPTVWTVCLLFFQGMLLIGYTYAHLITQYLRPKAQVITHLLLMLAAAISLPLSPSLFRDATNNSMPVLNILYILGGSLGITYLFISSNSPLLQKWISSGKTASTKPYRLYTLSNAGSLLALVSYPFLFEPYLSRAVQVKLWSVGMVILLVSLAICQIPVWRFENNMQKQLPVETKQSPGSSMNTFFWFCLSACASAILLSVTNKICFDIAAVPFLWVLPLCLYLITFMICFNEFPVYSRHWYGGAYFTMLIAVCGVLYLKAYLGLYWQLSVYLSALFFGCMICNGELVKLKPPATELTWFYLIISLGGVSGSIAVAVLAPLIFSDFYEFQISLMTAGLLMFIIIWYQSNKQFRSGILRKWAYLVSIWLVAGLALIVEAVHSRQDVINIHRNFFGTLKVSELYSTNPQRHQYLLNNGDVIHGFQLLRKDLMKLPTSYYGENSGGGLAMRYLTGEKGRKIGIIGLGTGTLAVYGKKDDVIRFYEINPAIIRIAKEQFTFLSETEARIEILEGDARLLLEREKTQHYDLLIVDAFSNDSIPVHLLTIEAIKLYFKHLNPNGILSIHLSNRYLDLRPVIRTAAEELKVEWGLIEDTSPTSEYFRTLPSIWMLMSRNDQFFKLPSIKKTVNRKNIAVSRVRLWTDDYTALFPLIK